MDRIEGARPYVDTKRRGKAYHDPNHRPKAPTRWHRPSASEQARLTWKEKEAVVARVGMLAAMAALAATASGCLAPDGCVSEDAGEIEADAGSGGAAGGAAADRGSAGGNGIAEPCPGTGGPVMVRLPEGYCIDSTEVTRADYGTWLAAGAPSTASIEECAWNTTFMPDATCMSRLSVCQGSGCGDHPQVCVDWCDAYAYCQAVGKRLCGKIDGGSNDPEALADATQSQWYNACSSHGVNALPYGVFMRGVCNDIENSATRFTVPVASYRDCQPSRAYGGVYDLSGNVWEWEDSCTGPGAGGKCLRRGGSYVCITYYLLCDYGYEGTRDEADEDVGFRCCAP